MSAILIRSLIFMNSPIGRNNISLVESPPSVRDIMDQDIEIDRNIFGGVLKFCIIYECIFTIISFSIVKHYGFRVGDVSCNYYLPIWIICCCLVYQCNLLLHSLRFYWSDPSYSSLLLIRYCILHPTRHYVR